MSVRNEASDRFFRWREVSHLTQGMVRHRRQRTDAVVAPWKEKEWGDYLSYDVAKRLKDDSDPVDELPRRCYEAGFDPLHFTSVVMFALSVMSPTKLSIGAFFRDWNVRFAMVSGFCFGLGIGLWLR